MNAISAGTIELSNANCAIGIDLGGTRLKYALISPQGEIYFSGETPSQALLSSNAVLEKILTAIAELLHIAKQQDFNVTCVGLGSPGTIDVETGQVKSGAQNITGWHGYSLRDNIAKHIKLPVYVDNDANLIAMGESVYGAAKSKTSALVVTLGTGIGGAILIDGELMRGTNNASAEFGCMVLPQFSDEKTLHYVSWESLASAKALVQRFGEISVQAGKHYSHELDGRFLFEQYHQGDTSAAQAIDENVYWLGLGIANLINIFNPEQVVIGGGISEAGEFYIEKIRHHVFKVAEVGCAANVEIVAATLGNRAGVLGAAYMALQLTERSKAKPTTNSQQSLTV